MPFLAQGDRLNYEMLQTFSPCCSGGTFVCVSTEKDSPAGAVLNNDIDREHRIYSHVRS